MPVISRFLSPGVFSGERESGQTTSLGNAYDPSFANTTGERGYQDGYLLPSGVFAQRPLSSNRMSFAPETESVQIDNIPIAEPQRSYDFRVLLPSIPGAVTPLAEATDATPIESTQQSSEPVGGRYRHFPGLYMGTPLPIVLYHNQESDGLPGHVALEYLRAWKKLIQNDDGTYNYPIGDGGNGYWKPIFLELRNVNQQRGYLIEYSGCWPISAQPIRMQFAQSTRTVVMATFSCNRIIPNVQSGGSLSGGATYGQPSPGYPSDALAIQMLNV